MKIKRILALTTVCAMALGSFGLSYAEETAAEGVNAAAENTFVEPVFGQTTKGWLMGYKQDSTYMFKGIQYGVVTERFMPAAEPEAWEGVKAALVYGETAPNTSNTVSISSFVDNAVSDMVQNEQCLFLNVWTQSLDQDAKKPVIFFMHGGGFSAGASNELAVYDGKGLSEAGDVVYITMNHRLNYLGYTDLSAYGEEYAMSGDVGMQDLVLALKWVRDNAVYFGGDPENVTIVGQSGGGSKVALLLQIPEAADLFERGMICSGTGMFGPVSFGTPAETAQEAGKALVEKTKETCGIESDEEALDFLKTCSYETLCNLAQDTGAGSSPSVGNAYIPEVYSSENQTWPEVSKDKALIVSNTFGELAGNDGKLVMPMLINMDGASFDPENPDAFLHDIYKPNLTEEDQLALVEATYGEDTEAILAEFAKAFPCRDTIDVLSVNKARQHSTNMCVDKANQGGAPVYNCVFAYEYPIMGGIMNYHTGGDLSLLLHTLALRTYMIQGDEETAYKLEDIASKALINFAYTGDPSSDLLAWPAFTAENGETMIFDDESQVINYPDVTLLELVNAASSGESAGN